MPALSRDKRAIIQPFLELTESYRILLTEGWMPIVIFFYIAHKSSEIPILRIHQILHGKDGGQSIICVFLCLFPFFIHQLVYFHLKWLKSAKSVCDRCGCYLLNDDVDFIEAFLGWCIQFLNLFSYNTFKHGIGQETI